MKEKTSRCSCTLSAVSSSWVTPRGSGEKMKRVNRFLMTVTRNKFVESTKPIPRNPKPRKHLKLLDKRPIITSQRKSNADHIEAALQMGLGWRIVGATWVRFWVPFFNSVNNFFDEDDSFILYEWTFHRNRRVLHRYPVITPDPTPWEVEMLELQEKIGLAQREVCPAKLQTGTLRNISVVPVQL